MTVPTVEQAIVSIEILNNLKPGNINEASTFLTELQKSSYAWSIADQLLYTDKDLYTSYFGAQTMRIKIQLQFEELPVDSHISLKESLKKHLLSSNVTSHVTVSKQLCLALADLFCHMVQWNNSLREIIDTLSQTAAGVTMLLDVLKYIPEEYNNKSLRLGVNRKTQIFGELEQYRLMVVSMLQGCLSLGSDTVMIGVLECLDSWFLLNIFRDNDLCQSSLVALVYQVLQRPAEASEALFKAAVQCATDFFCHNIHRTPGLIRLFQTETYSLEQVYRQCESVKPEYCLEYAKIFCEMAAALLPSVLSSPRFDADGSLGDVRTLQLLVLTARSSRECCGFVLDVLADVTHHNTTIESDEYRAQVTSIFEELVSVMTRHCAFTNVNDEQSLSEFRADVFNVMEEIRLFVDVESLFRKMLENLSFLLTNPSNDNAKEAEAVLCMISSLVKFVDTESQDNATWTEQLLVAVILPNVAQSQPSFKSVSFTLFSELCRWISSRTPIMDSVIHEMASFVMSGCDEDNDLAVEAMDCSLRSLSIYNKRSSEQMMSNDSHWAMLFGVCQSFANGTIVSREMVPFYESLGKAILHTCSSVAISQSPEQMANKLLQLIQVNIGVIERLVQTKTQSKVARHVTNPTIWIDNISAVMQSLAKVVSSRDQRYTAALYGIFEQYLWPAISSLIDCYIADGHVLERVVRIFRYSQRSFQTMTKPLLSSIAPKMVGGYVQSRESCFLYIAGILVDEFGDDSECTMGLVQMFHAMCSAAIPVLAGQGLYDNPHTSEDLFRLMVRLVQHCSCHFLGWDQLTSLGELCDMAVRCLSGTKIDAKLLSMRFLVETVSTCVNSGAENGQSRESTVARQRLLTWVQSGHGALHIITAILHLCRWNPEEVLEEDLGSDMADLVNNLRSLIDNRDHFIAIFDEALTTVGVSRRDGLLYANEAQVGDLRQSLLRDELTLLALEDFARLFM